MANTNWNGIRVEPEDRKLLALYKLEHGLKSYSTAIRHAIERAEEGRPLRISPYLDHDPDDEGDDG